MLDSLLHQAYTAVDRLGQSEEALDAVRLVLIHVYVPAMAALLTLTACALLMARAPLRARLGAVPLRAWLWALVIFNIALTLRLFWVPHMPQVFFDEISFLNTSDNMARTDLNLLSTTSDTNGLFFHPCPAGWQFLISRVWQIVGTRPEVAFALASTISALSVLLIFLVLFEMTGRARVGLWGALFLAVLPVHLRLSGSSALETPSVFFLLATLYAMRVWRATGARSALLLTATMFAWFANTRMENTFALGPLLLLYMLVQRPRERGNRWDAAATIGCALIAGVFSVPALLADAYGVATRFYFFYQPQALTQAQIASNWRGNIPYWFDNGFHPALLTALALGGAFSIFRPSRHRRDVIFWMVWTGSLVAFYSMNPSCDFSLRHTLDSWRTAMHPALGIIMLAAIGARLLIDAAGRPWLRRTITLTLILAAGVTPWLFSDFIASRHMWMLQWDAMTRMREALSPSDILLVREPNPLLAPDRNGLAYELTLTTGVAPRFFVCPDAETLAESPELPEILRSIEAWKVEKRRVFLYHLDAGRVEDAHALGEMQSLLDLDPAGGLSMRATHASFSLWRVQGVAQRLVDAPRRKALR